MLGFGHHALSTGSNPGIYSNVCATTVWSMFQELPDRLHKCYVRSMTEVPSRELRNSTADVLRRVAAGEDVVITVNGRGVARLLPIQPQRRRWIDRAELVRRLGVAQADPGLRDDLAELAGDTTDDLGPVS